jgi:hypothetical protein
VYPRSEGDVVINGHRERIRSLGKKSDFLSQVDDVCPGAIDAQSINEDIPRDPDIFI